MAIIIGIGFMFLALLLSTALAVFCSKTIGKELSTYRPRFFAYVQIMLTPMLLFVSSTVILIAVLASYNNDPNIKALMYGSLAVSLQLVGVYVVGGLIATPMLIKKRRN